MSAKYEVKFEVYSYWEMSDFTKKRILEMTETEYIEYRAGVYQHAREAERERNMHAANLISYNEEYRLAEELRKTLL